MNETQTKTNNTGKSKFKSVLSYTDSLVKLMYSLNQFTHMSLLIFYFALFHKFEKFFFTRILFLSL